MRLSWVIGAGGLLGSAFTRALLEDGATLFAHTAPFKWSDAAQLSDQIKVAVADFSRAARQASRWEIFWAAGVGTMASDDESLVAETVTLKQLLHEIGTSAALLSINGSIAFASSAGAIYGACADEVITESSLPAPNNAYGRTKLEQEALLQSFGAHNPQLIVLLTRISTLYGVGQSVGKPQGLLTHIARSIVRNKPVGIFVPIDTIRDYISADDAAAGVIEVLRGTLEGQRPQTLVKIVASGTPATIAEIISIFKAIAKKPPRITTSAGATSALYLRRVKFCSVVAGGRRPQRVRGLPVGIAQLFRAEQLLLASARCSAP